MDKNTVIKIINISIIILCLSLAAIIGGYYTCKNSNGVMTQTFTCTGINVVDVCEIKGEYYIPNNNNENLIGFNWTVPQ